MNPDEILEQVRAGFQRRKFSAGLAMAFIDFLIGIGAVDDDLTDYPSFLKKYPRRETTERGEKANTLIVELHGGGTKSIRFFYDRVQNEIRAVHCRLDYPSAAPHATQAWQDYTHWIGAMVATPKTDLAALRSDILAFILETLPSHEIDESLTFRDPPIFSLVLEKFDLGVGKGEPTGAAFQGAVFGYLRADAPHLQVEVRKVRTGSKRVGGIGDIDAWDGDRLILSAEAKHTLFLAKDVPGIEGFCNTVSRHKAIGLVVAESFEPAARTLLQEKGISAIAREELIATVALWDPLKQLIAARAFLYYASHVEQNGALTERLKTFLKSPDGEVHE